MKNTLLLLFVFSPMLLAAQGWDAVIPNRSLYSLVANPHNASTLFAGNVSRTFFKSLDGGTTWEEMAIQSFGGGSFITTMFVVPTDTNVVLAAGLGFDGIDRSTDGGQTWKNAYKSSDGSRTEFNGPTSIMALSAKSDTLLAVRFSDGIVYRSNNKGANWDSLSTIPGLLGTDRIRSLAPSPDSSHIVLAGGRTSWVYKSTNSGRSWVSTKVRLSGHPDGDIAMFKWSPTTAGVVYATVQYSLAQNLTNAGLMKSTDYGDTWERIRFKDTSLYALEIIATPNGDEIYVGGGKIDLAAPDIVADSIVYRSVNGGEVWQDIGNINWTTDENGVTFPNVWGIAASWVNGAPVVVVGSQAGCFRGDYITSVHGPSASRDTDTEITYNSYSNTLRINSRSAKLRFALITLTGEVVSTGSITCTNGEAEISLPNLAAGVYVAQAFDEFGTKSIILLK